MASYSFENKYERQTYFEFREDEMYVKEIWIGDQIREYRFKYIDISRYSIVPDIHGYYSIDFWSNEKKIEQMENGQKKYVTLINIKIKKDMIDTPLLSRKIIDDVNDIRNVIYNNTPLRSELDLMQEKSKSIYELYENTPENEFGTIYLQGPRKEFNEYCIHLNNIPFFTIYTSKQEKKLKDVGQYKESIAKPYWVDNQTIAFRIPYGKWNIGYSFKSTAYPSVDSIHGVNYTTGPQNIDIIVDMQHPEIRIRTKHGLLKNKLIEVN